MEVINNMAQIAIIYTNQNGNAIKKVHTDYTTLLDESDNFEFFKEVNVTFDNINLTIPPKILTAFTNLTVLRYIYCNLDVLSPLIGNLTNLEQLELVGNKLTDLPDELWGLVNLSHLDIGGNNLNQISSGIGNLINLETLYLNDNHLVDIPVEIGNLENLSSLILNSNNLLRLPREIGYLTNLKKLFLHYNNLRRLPSQIGHLTELSILNVSNNRMDKLPKSIGNLTNLSELYLHNNNLVELPLEIINLRTLRNFSYQNNPIENLANPLIVRFLDFYERFYNIHDAQGTIYDDAQNVHASSIQQSIHDSIFKLMKSHRSDYQLDYLNCDVLDTSTKEILTEFCDCTDVHSVLNITFAELLVAVMIEIETLTPELQREVKNRLNEEMNESVCKCFTGRISRLVNCLSGYSNKVLVKISDSEEIGNIISLAMNKFTNTEEIKEHVTKELTERGYDETTINKWLEHIE